MAWHRIGGNPLNEPIMTLALFIEQQGTQSNLREMCVQYVYVTVLIS